LTVFGDRAEAGDTAWGRVLWLGGRYGSAVDTWVLVGACAESLAGWGPFPNWEPEDGRAVLLGGAQCEVVGRGADGSISFLLWGEPGRASVWGGAGCKGVLKIGNGRWRAVLSSGILCEVAGQAVDGSISFLLWGEPGRASVWGGAGLQRLSQNGKREVEGGTFEWDPVRSCWTGGCRKYQLLAVG
jgi:hypothetical protein